MVGEAKLRMGGPEWALVAALGLLWAGSYLFFKVLAAALPPFTVVFGRVAIAAAALNLVVLARGARLPGTARPGRPSPAWGSPTTSSPSH